MAYHSHYHPRFCVCVPLLTTTTPENYAQAWLGLNHLIRGIGVRSKNTCHSLFPTPEHIEDTSWEFHSFTGDILTAEDWIRFAPINELNAYNSAQQCDDKETNAYNNLKCERETVMKKSTAGRSNHNATFEDTIDDHALHEEVVKEILEEMQNEERSQKQNTTFP